MSSGIRRLGKSTGSGALQRPAILVVLLSLVFAACGGRGGDDNETAKADSTPAEAPALQDSTEEQPAAESAPAETVPAEAPGAAPSTPSAAAPVAPAPSAAKAPAPKASAPKPAAAAAPKAQATPGKPATGTAGGSGGPSATPSGSPAAPGEPAKATAPAPAPPGPAGAPGPANLSPVHIGSICECSGPAGASIGAGIASIQTVVKWINDSGGLNGHPIKLFVADSNSDPNRYFALLKRMVEVDKVLAFAGHMSPLTINAGDKYLREKGIPVVGGDGAHGLWFNSPVLFFPGPSYTSLSVATAKYAVSVKTPKIAMFYCAEAQPCQVGRDALHSKLMAEKAPEAEIVYEAKVSLAQPDFTPECLQAQSNGAQAVILFVDAAAASRATRSCIQQGYRPQWMGSPLTSAHPDDPNNDGMAAPIATFPWFLEETPAQKQFQDAIRQHNPDLVKNATTSVVWVAGKMLMEATKNLPADNPTSQDILNGLWAIQNNGFDGLIPEPVTFVKDQPSPDHYCYFVVQIKDKKYTAPLGSKPQCL